MSENVPRMDSGCSDYSDDLAELALGALTGRDRARALAHVDECPRCAEELEQLSRVADAVLQTAPEVEPPVGFESRLFERMGVAESAPGRRLRSLPSLGSRRPRQWMVAAVAAAAAFAALGLGLSTATAPPATQAQGVHGSQNGSQNVVTGNFVQDGRTVGHVVVAGGARPWVSMMLEDSTAQGAVNCVVVTQDGVTHEIGSFVAHAGYGAWVAPLHLDPKDVSKAEVVSPSGAVIASATLT